MIKLVAGKKGGGRILLLGLSAVNIERLKNNDPIHFFLAELGNYGKDEVVIMYGETEESIQEDLRNVFGDMQPDGQKEH